MIREITIIAVLNGWIIKVGCQTVVFQSLDEMLGELKSYYIDPISVEKSYLKDSINSAHTVRDQAIAGQLDTRANVVEALRGVADEINSRTPRVSGIYASEPESAGNLG